MQRQLQALFGFRLIPTETPAARRDTTGYTYSSPALSRSWSLVERRMERASLPWQPVRPHDAVPAGNERPGARAPDLPARGVGTGDARLPRARRRRARRARAG